jgi:uncharacterized protein with GYD domain
MKFLALMKWHENTSDKIAGHKFIEEMGGADGMFNLPDGVTILEGARVFGPYALVIFYEAPDEEAAKKVLAEYNAYATIERYLTARCPLCENSKQ